MERRKASRIRRQAARMGPSKGSAGTRLASLKILPDLQIPVRAAKLQSRRRRLAARPLGAAQVSLRAGEGVSKGGACAPFGLRHNLLCLVGSCSGAIGMTHDAASLALPNPKAAQIRIEFDAALRAAGQRAHDLREGPQPEYVDASRSPLNRILMKPVPGATLKTVCAERRARRKTKRAMKSNASVCISGILTFGHEAQPIFERLGPEAQDAAYREAAEAVARRLNTTLTGLVVHCDESAPHAHFQTPSYDLDGEAISEKVKKSTLRDLQTLVAEVMGRHAPGIERGRSRLERLKAGAKPSEVVHKSVRQLHDELPREIAQRRRELEELQEAVDLNRRRADAARGKAERLQANEARAAQALKTAQTYEDRAQKAQEKLDALERRIAEQERASAARSTRDQERAAELDAALEARRADLEAKAEEIAQETERLSGIKGEASAFAQDFAGRQAEAAELSAKLAKSRQLLTDQEEIRILGKEILARIEEEISEGQKKLEEVKQETSAQEERFKFQETRARSLRKSSLAFSSALQKANEAFSLAMLGRFETEITVEDLQREGRSPREAEELHRSIRRAVTPNRVTLGWRLYWEATVDPQTPFSRPIENAEAFKTIYDLFYEARDLCRRVRREREAAQRSILRQVLTGAALREAQTLRSELAARKTILEGEVRKDLEKARARIPIEVDREKRGFLDQARAEVEQERASLLAAAHSEAEALEASLLSDGGKELKALRSENVDLKRTVRHWAEFWNFIRESLKAFFGADRFEAFRADYSPKWAEHPQNPNRPKPEAAPPAKPRSGPNP